MYLALVILGGVGQAIVTIGMLASVRSYGLYVFGNVLVKYRSVLTTSSIGASNVLIMSTTFEAVWFKNRETSIAMIIDAIFQIIYSSSMFFTHPFIFKHSGSLAVCFGAVLILCLFSITAAVMLAFIDKYAPVFVNSEDEKEAEVYRKFSLKIFTKLGYPLWLLAISHISAEGTNILLVHIIVAFFRDRFGLSIEASGILTGAVPIAVSALGLPMGIIVYNFGLKGHISKLYNEV